MMKPSTALAGALLGALVVTGSAAFAQDLPGCTTRTVTDPPRTVYDCAGGLVIELEGPRGASALSAPPAAPITMLEMTGGAALIEVAPGGAGFQIGTPQAIAAVRGTQFAVTYTDDVTAVFVLEGQVEVARRGTHESAALSAGDGIELADGAPLEVRQWPQDKVAALLARFGR